MHKEVSRKWRTRLAPFIVAAAIVPLAACSGATGTASQSASLTIGYPVDPAPQGYDPQKYNAAQSTLFEGLYASLFDLSKDGKAQPSLAKSFAYNDDKTVLTLALQSGVTFSDGSKLDAGLVKANLDRRSDSALVGYTSIAKGGQTEIASVDVVDDSHVAIHFTKPQPGFESNFASLMGMIVGESAIKDPKSLATTPDGSGAYTLDKSTVKGSSYVLTKKDKGGFELKDYPFQKIVVKPITDPQARANALISGQIDTAQLAPSTVELVKSRGVGISQVGGTVFSLLAFDKLGKIVPAFGSEQVRQAIQYAIDRKSLVTALHKGFLPAWNALPKSSPGYTDSLNKEFAYNPSKAKELLASAGYADGFTFQVIATPDTQTDLQAVQKDLAAVGITMDVKLATSTDEAFAAVTTTALGPIALTWADPVGVTHGAVMGFANMQGAQDEKLNEAVNAAAAASTDADKAKALTALNERLVESGWVIPIYELLTSTGYNKTKLKSITYPGYNSFPLLSSYAPASK